MVARLRVHVSHVAQEELLEHETVKVPRVLLDRLLAHGEEGAGCEADGGGYLSTGEEDVPVFGGGPGGVDAHHRRPFLPAGVFFPWDAVPVVKGLELAEGEGGDLAGLGLEGTSLDLVDAEGDVVVDVALEEEGHVGE